MASRHDTIGLSAGAKGGSSLPSIVPIALITGRPMDSINMYLILDDPVTLIDAGLPDQRTYDLLEQTLSKYKLDVSHIQRIVLTHVHPDHVGITFRLQEKSRAKLYMHPLEWHKLKNGQADNVHLYQWTGIPEDYRMDTHKTSAYEKHLPEITSFIDHGDTIPFSAFSLRCLHTPGHCSGHICLYEEKTKCLFTGDHLVPHFSPALLVEPGNCAIEDRTPSLSQYMESLQKISSLSLLIAYPGHGKPFENILELINHKKKTIPEKLNRIASFLNQKPQTVYSITTQMILELPPSLAFFACGDTLAYLDYLQKEGRAQSRIDHSQIQFFTPER